jgi:hypothetical protein
VAGLDGAALCLVFGLCVGLAGLMASAASSRFGIGVPHGCVGHVGLGVGAGAGAGFGREGTQGLSDIGVVGSSISNQAQGFVGFGVDGLAGQVIGGGLGLSVFGILDGGLVSGLVRGVVGLLGHELSGGVGGGRGDACGTLTGVVA